MRAIAISVTAAATLTFLIVVSGVRLVRAAAAPVEKVNASYGAISGSMMPISVTKEAKLFEKQGLELNLVYISGGPRAIMSLIGGSVQFEKLRFPQIGRVHVC